jgi:hypothetical protein
MKTKDKLIKLLEHGFEGNLLSELNENQINTLYGKLTESKKENKEAVTTKSSVESTKYTGTEVAAMKSKGQGLQVNGEVLPTSDGGLEVIKRTGSPTSETTESEMNEDSDGDLDLALALQSKEITEKFESKAQQKYFWAKCDKSTGKEKKKWCDMAKEFSKSTTKKDYKKMPEKLHPEKTVRYKKKKETNENYLDMIGKAYNKNMQNKIADISPSLNWTESEIERGIMKLLEKHITPKMTKREFLSLVSEQGTKEKTKEKEKTREKEHDSPYKPKPGVKPIPKAKKEETNEQNAPTIAPPKPGTKPTTRPDTPYKPKPGPKKSPKAGRNEMPNWLSFKSIGIKLK